MAASLLVFFFASWGQFLYIPVPQQPGVVCQVKINLEHLHFKTNSGRDRQDEEPGNTQEMGLLNQYS